MIRRTFVGGAALGALVGPRVTLAQTARKVARIGILGLAPTADLVGPQPKSRSAEAFLR